MARSAGGTRRWRGAGLAVAGVALACAAAAIAAPGDPDASFDGDGRRTIALPGAEFAQAVALQPDGRIVLGGSAAGGGEFVGARLRPDGSDDPSFDLDGSARVDFGGFDFTEAVALQSDGAVVMAGFTSVGENIAVARLRPDGALDPAFNGTGKRTIDLGGTDLARAVAVQADGRILVAGGGGPGGDFQVTRLNPDGSIDLTFDGDGTTTVDFGGNDVATAIAVPPDGRIVVAGWTGAGLVPGSAAVARLRADGSLDAGFGTGGRRTIDYGGTDSAESVVVQPDGKVVLAGTGGAGVDLVVARLRPDGTDDPSFDGDGRVQLALGPGDSGEAVALQANGKIVAAGFTGGDFAVARLQPGGSPDTTFGPGGVRTVDFGAADEGYAVSLQADGRVVVAGLSADDIAIARLDGDGAAGAPAGSGAGVAGAGGAAAGRGAVPRCAGRPATIVGTARRDVLRGTRRADVIVALGGDDVVRAGGGRDLVCGGAGRDRLSGGPGRDRLLGGAGRDRLDGGAGRDSCVGGAGRDQSACEVRRP